MISKQSTNKKHIDIIKIYVKTKENKEATDRDIYYINRKHNEILKELEKYDIEILKKSFVFWAKLMKEKQYTWSLIGFNRNLKSIFESVEIEEHKKRKYEFNVKRKGEIKNIAEIIKDIRILNKLR